MIVRSLQVCLFLSLMRQGGWLSSIEHAQVGGQWEKGVGARVVGLTDWLLGGMKKDEEGTPCPAFWCENEEQERRRR